MSWENIATKEDAEELLKEEHADFTTTSSWHGPGWYYVTTVKERCPRGCCYDYTATLVSAEKKRREIQEKMQKLADELRIANEKVLVNEGRLRQSPGSG